MARTKLTTIDAETDRFPETYLGDYDGELEYVIYEWQTRRYPVNAKVQGDVDGDFTVQAGRSDTISDPAIYTDNREARTRRAEYVHAAVDGRNVTSGEEMTVPIPGATTGSWNYSTGWKPTARRSNGRTLKTSKPR